MRYSFILVAMLFIPVISYSDTIVVPDDYPTIQGAIDAAVNGDTVLVKPGTYVENIDFKGKGITVESESGFEATTIDGGNPADPDYGSVIYFHSGESLDSVLDGFTITNGTGTKVGSGFHNGGGIYCYANSSPTIINNHITGNSVFLGGGIGCRDQCSPVIAYNIIEGNHVIGQDGGGISCPFSSPLITHNIISRNTVTDDGGGITLHYSSATITNNIISGNIASGDDGGGICCFYSDPTITSNMIIGNTVGHDGGGVWCYHSSPIISNNIISGNRAARGGGGISCESSSPSITNNTLSKNTGTEGGGIWCYYSSPTVVNTIVWENHAPSGSEIYLYSGSPTVSYSDIKGGYPGIGNINDAPLFVDPDNGDFHLTFNSPCRGSGDNAAPNLPSTDFEGDPRIYQAAVDIGADEFCTHLYCTGDAKPGNIVYGKLVGLPGTSPVCILFGTGIIDPPMPTMWGGCCLEAPLLLLQLMPIPSNGVLIVPASVPLVPSAPYDIPMQALIGLNADSLTNLCVLEVR